MYPVSNYVCYQEPKPLFIFLLLLFNFLVFLLLLLRLRWIEDGIFCVCAQFIPTYFFTLIWFLTHFIFTYKFHLANREWTRKSVTDFAISNEAHVLNVIIFIDVHSQKQKSIVLFRRQENGKYGTQSVKKKLK